MTTNITMRHVIRKLTYYFIRVYCCSISYNAFGLVPVIDSANLHKSFEQAATLSNQLVILREQLRQIRRQYSSITGNRGFGDSLYNHNLYELIPSGYQDIYEATGDSDIQAALSSILNKEELKGSIDEIQKSIEKRSKNTYAVNKALGLKGQKNAEARLKQIEDLMHKIRTTQDLKSIAEIQARIQIEQSAIENEITKLQMVTQLQQAEHKLIIEQKHEMSRRILNVNNTEMPKIRG